MEYHIIRSSLIWDWGHTVKLLRSPERSFIKVSSLKVLKDRYEVVIWSDLLVLLFIFLEKAYRKVVTNRIM